ncbi:glycosyltransferase family 2 protein [Flavobacterium sp. WC2509]|uniref:glycosyltransferase family 2 protein n=1 Tax=Flavobacterium sp. WC2509 TaxID=3461406 RepID=UPI0040440022
MTSIPTIAVLLTCHNRKEKTLQCIQALYEQEDQEVNYIIEVFLVDDASTDGTSEAIKFQFPKINVIRGNGNLYWNRGMHLAWETAADIKDYDYYLWLNDDTFLFKNAIKMLLNDAHLSNKKSVICGSTISLETNTISYGGFSKDSKMLIPNGELQEVFTINGNCVLIPKFVFKTIGILDKRFPHAIGDFEYGLRVRKNNLTSHISGDFIGSCEGSEKLPIWCSPSVSLYKRIQNLYSPLGNSHPYYYYLFEQEYYGSLIAVKHLLTIHLRLLFPTLWIKKNRLFSK